MVREEPWGWCRPYPAGVVGSGSGFHAQQRVLQSLTQAHLIYFDVNCKLQLRGCLLRPLCRSSVFPSMWGHRPSTTVHTPRTHQINRSNAHENFPSSCTSCFLVTWCQVVVAPLLPSSLFQLYLLMSAVFLPCVYDLIFISVKERSQLPLSSISL